MNCIRSYQDSYPNISPVTVRWPWPSGRLWDT